MTGMDRTERKIEQTGEDLESPPARARRIRRAIISWLPFGMLIVLAIAISTTN